MFNVQTVHERYGSSTAWRPTDSSKRGHFEPIIERTSRLARFCELLDQGCAVYLHEEGVEIVSRPTDI